MISIFFVSQVKSPNHIPDVFDVHQRCFGGCAPHVFDWLVQQSGWHADGFGGCSHIGWATGSIWLLEQQAGHGLLETGNHHGPIFWFRVLISDRRKVKQSNGIQRLSSARNNVRNPMWGILPPKGRRVQKLQKVQFGNVWDILLAEVMNIPSLWGPQMGATINMGITIHQPVFGCGSRAPVCRVNFLQMTKLGTSVGMWTPFFGWLLMTSPYGNSTAGIELRYFVFVVLKNITNSPTFSKGIPFGKQQWYPQGDMGKKLAN